MISSRTNKLLLLVLMYASFIVFLFATDPNKLAIGWLIAPFIWLFVILFLSTIFVIDWIGPQGRLYQRRVSLSVMIALVPTLILLLDSINQLTLKDGLLIAIFGAIASFYAAKYKIQK